MSDTSAGQTADFTMPAHTNGGSKSSLKPAQLSALLALLMTLIWNNHAFAVDWSRPWVEPQDTLAALTQSDEYAWRLFVALNWPGNAKSREADTKQTLGADRPTVWETWRNAKDVFLSDGADPGAWHDGPAPIALASSARFDSLPLAQLHSGAVPLKVLAPKTDPLTAGLPVNETHMNRQNFEFIRSEELFNIEGQLRHFGEAVEVSFPVGAKEVKAQWREINPDQKSRYHTVTVVAPDGRQKLYGLTALHITSKDLPNWFWATFEHVDNPTLSKTEGWLLKSQDSFACRGQASDCNRVPTGVGLEGTVWQYYRLRGTQINFTDARGEPTLLANSQLEKSCQTTASCITCHARATIGHIDGKPARLALFDFGPAGSNSNSMVQSFNGAPKPEWFSVDTEGAGKQRLFLQLDFEWSLLKAQSKSNADKSGDLSSTQ